MIRFLTAAAEFRLQMSQSGGPDRLWFDNQQCEINLPRLVILLLNKRRYLPPAQSHAHRHRCE